MNTYCKGLLCLGVVVGGMPAMAATNGFVVPTFRGQAGASFYGWESFLVAQGEPGNAPDMAGSSAGVRLFQTAPGAQVLGSGNIYNGANPSVFEIRYTLPEGAAELGLVNLQMRTLGTELSYDFVRLVAATDTSSFAAVASRNELDRVAFGPPPPNPGSGVGVSSLWQWDLSGMGVTYFAISLPSTELNLSLDSATLDVQLIPEPGVVGLGVLGGLLLLIRRRSA